MDRPFRPTRPAALDLARCEAEAAAREYRQTIYQEHVARQQHRESAYEDAGIAPSDPPRGVDGLHICIDVTEPMRAIQEGMRKLAESGRLPDILRGWTTPPPMLAPPTPYQPTAGERKLAREAEAAGWVDVEILPPSHRTHQVDDSIEVVGFDAHDPDWRIHIDGGSDGHAEGYTITRASDYESTGRIRSPRVPTPNEAVGAFEREMRTLLEQHQPIGRKG